MTFGAISPAHPVIAPSALQLKLEQAQADAQAASTHAPPPFGAAGSVPANPSGLLDTLA